MNRQFSWCSGSMVRMGTSIQEFAMLTALKLLTGKFWRPSHDRLDDHLLCDLGLSRVETEYRRG
jgi:hypothetical protein